MSSRILPQFELLLPQSIEEAISALEAHGDQAAVMAGGTDLMVLMKTGFSPAVLVSLCELAGLDYVEFDSAGGLRLGAMATLAQVESSPVVKERYPALWASARANGTPQTRRMGTVVGNILRASPAGDCCCAVLAIGGSVVLEGPRGRREVDIDQFWQDYRITARQPEELAIELKLPSPAPGARSAFAALTRTYFDLAKINAAASLTMDGDTCQAVRLAMGAVAPTPLRLKACEQLLQGREVSEDLLDQVAAKTSAEISPIDDVRSTADYRRQVAGVLLKRVIQQALATK